MTREQDSYDVYVKVAVDRLGVEDFGTAVAHFASRSNAVELKRELEARGAIVRVEKSVVRLSEEGRDAWFSDDELPPPQQREDGGDDARAPAGVEEPRQSWWRRAFDG